MNLRLVQILFVSLIAWQFFNSALWETEPLLFLPSLLLIFLTCWPAITWFNGGAIGIPVAETYCLLHLQYYLMPMLEQRGGLLIYSLETQWIASLAVCTFLLGLQATYHLLGPSAAPKLGWLSTFVARSAPRRGESLLIWSLFGLWFLFGVLLYTGRLPDFGNALNAARSVFGSGGGFAVFYLCHALGAGSLRPKERLLLLSALTIYVTLAFTSVFLVSGVIILLTAMLAYTMGSKRPPVVLALILGLGIGFLHAGKGEVRTRYWQEGTNSNSSRVNPLEMYTSWFRASWSALGSGSESRSPFDPLIDRSGGLLELVSLVVDETPERSPHLYGITYLQIVVLIIPRVFWPEKPRGSLPTETLGIYYGIQTEESVEYTAIGFGPIAEAWSNFGWFGLFLVGAAFGAIFSVAKRLSSFAAPNQAGFILAALMVPFGVNLELSLAEWLISLVQSLAVGGLVVATLFRALSAETPAQWARNQEDKTLG